MQISCFAPVAGLKLRSLLGLTDKSDAMDDKPGATYHTGPAGSSNVTQSRRAVIIRTFDSRSSAGYSVARIHSKVICRSTNCTMVLADCDGS